MRRPTPAELERLAVERGGSVRRVHLPAVNYSDAVVESTPGVHTLVLGGFIPTPLNKTMRGKIRDRCRIGRDTHAYIAAEAARQGIPPATEGRRVTLHVYFPKGRSRPDPDALFKSLGDAMKACGLLRGDEYEWVTWMPVVYWIGATRTEVVMEDIPEKVVTHREHAR